MYWVTNVYKQEFATKRTVGSGSGITQLTWLWLWCVDACVCGLRECWGLGVHGSVRVPGYTGYIMYVLQGKLVQGTRQMQKIYTSKQNISFNPNPGYKQSIIQF